MYAYLICARTMALVMAQHMANVNAKKTTSDFIVNTTVGIMIKCLIAYDEYYKFNETLSIESLERWKATGL